SFGKAQGIVIFPFIIVANPHLAKKKSFINHEKIHCAQALEMAVILFYLWYVFEFLVKWVWYRNFNLAYLNISFEREAYANESNLKYLYSRRFWSFLKYI